MATKGGYDLLISPFLLLFQKCAYIYLRIIIFKRISRLYMKTVSNFIVYFARNIV